MIIVAAIIKKEGQVLLAERKSKTGGWEFPGGKVEPKETPEQALIREIREELGVKIKVLKYLEKVSLPEKPEAQMMAFEAELLDNSIRLSSHRQFFWVRPEELLKYNLLPADRELVKKLKARDLLG
ncbi:MAG: (deoxy)nucleoside triphosphate pyrophosphohydrolase [Candidatus Saccharicenans sp.]